MAKMQKVIECMIQVSKKVSTSRDTIVMENDAKEEVLVSVGDVKQSLETENVVENVGLDEEAEEQMESSAETIESFQSESDSFNQ